MCRTLLSISAAILFFGPVNGSAQATLEDHARRSQIRWINNHCGEPIDVTLNDGQRLTTRPDRAFLDYFVIFENGAERRIRFDDVKDLKVHRTFKGRVGRALKYPAYLAGAVISLPGALLLGLGCVVDPDCR